MTKVVDAVENLKKKLKDYMLGRRQENSEAFIRYDALMVNGRYHLLEKLLKVDIAVEELLPTRDLPPAENGKSSPEIGILCPTCPLQRTGGGPASG